MISHLLTCSNSEVILGSRWLPVLVGRTCMLVRPAQTLNLGCQIPLAASNGRLEERRVICWEWKGNARDEGEKAAQWVSEVVGQPSRLVRFIGEPLHTPDTHLSSSPHHTMPQHGSPACSLAGPLQTLGP